MVQWKPCSAHHKDLERWYQDYWATIAIDHFLSDMGAIIQLQSRIGWCHRLKGRLALAWSDLQPQYTETKVFQLKHTPRIDGRLDFCRRYGNSGTCCRQATMLMMRWVRMSSMKTIQSKLKYGGNWTSFMVCNNQWWNPRRRQYYSLPRKPIPSTCWMLQRTGSECIHQHSWIVSSHKLKQGHFKVWDWSGPISVCRWQ